MEFDWREFATMQTALMLYIKELEKSVLEDKDIQGTLNTAKYLLEKLMCNM